LSGAGRLEDALPPWRVVRFDTIDSTNEEARRRALAGGPGRLWVVAEEQSAGRGRRGRRWVSPEGNLYASALLIEPCRAKIAPQLGFVAGVALARAAEDLGTAGARLKWPNDLMRGEAKCAGLLVEGVTLSDRRLACIVGIGANCRRAPEGVARPTAILTDRCGRPVDPLELFERLAARFGEALNQWRAGEGFEAILLSWLDRAAGLGQTIRIEDRRSKREGLFEGLDPAGRLLFRGESGVEAIETADLWITPAPDAPRLAASSASLAREGRP
jgi:BirA family biotin operon repressor/biotin-[acetyl-CoA-carboxylase] ligase